MPNNIIRADYDQLAQIATRFGQEAQHIATVTKDIRSMTSVLQNGDWVGQGANAFYAEMTADVLPSLARLAMALQSAQRTTLEIRATILQAERDAAAVLKDDGATYTPPPPTGGKGPGLAKLEQQGANPPYPLDTLTLDQARLYVQGLSPEAQALLNGIPITQLAAAFASALAFGTPYVIIGGVVISALAIGVYCFAYYGSWAWPNNPLPHYVPGGIQSTYPLGGNTVTLPGTAIALPTVVFIDKGKLRGWDIPASARRDFPSDLLGVPLEEIEKRMADLKKARMGGKQLADLVAAKKLLEQAKRIMEKASGKPR